jgi:hypothetical protein
MAVRDLVAAAERQPWRLESSQGGTLERWLELFAFADRPMELITALEQLPEWRRDPNHLRGISRTFRLSPHPDIAALLVELARRNEGWHTNHDWLAAFAASGTEAAGRALLGLLTTGVVAGQRGDWDLGDIVEKILRSHPALLDAALQSYEAMPHGPRKLIFEAAFAQIGEQHFILPMVHSYAGSGRSFGSYLQKTLSQVALRREPVDNRGAFELYSVPLVGLRQQLFELTTTDDAIAQIALQCLIEIDGYRDEHGRISGEPRHPDIGSGRPWPPQAGVDSGGA